MNQTCYKSRDTIALDQKEMISRLDEYVLDHCCGRRAQAPKGKGCPGGQFRWDEKGEQSPNSNIRNF